MSNELAHLVFVVLCLANEIGINLQAAFDKKMDLKLVRYKNSYKNNKKQK